MEPKEAKKYVSKAPGARRLDAFSPNKTVWPHGSASLHLLIGLFGMNVQAMINVLASPWTSHCIVAVMVAIAITMLSYFKRRGWF